MQYYIDFLRTPFETYAVNGAAGAGGDFDNATTTTHPFPIKAPHLVTVFGSARPSTSCNDNNYQHSLR